MDDCDRLRIQAVYLFGSRAAGRARPGSDLDFAVVSKNTPSAKDPLQFTLVNTLQQGRLTTSASFHYNFERLFTLRS
jgi:predicted nucleotidyltransferase